jgi:hypothetical protein
MKFGRKRMNIRFFRYFKKMSKVVTVYGLIASDEYFIRYIGQTVSTVKQRLAGHLSRARRKCTTPVSKWIKTVVDRGAFIQMIVLLNNAILHESEKLIIAFHRELGGRLLNITDGGEGTLGFHHSGRKRPDLAERNRANTGKPGRPRMPGEIEKLMQHVRGAKRPWLSERNRRGKGKSWNGRHTPDHIERVRLLHTGKSVSIETRQKLSESKKGKCSETQRLALAAVRKKRWSNRGAST